ncbi:hypothetical protein Fot_11303 [Forsythia ovata]|uniref:Uncharacterized protein n=1 Tax=Forsythia ovata TaxID=205694 RepID=A0ABD1WM19_9LAMI
MEPLNTSRLNGATEAMDISSEEEMSSEKTDEEWDFNWMGTPECHVIITELDDKTDVEHDKCDIHSNIEQDVNIGTEDETKRIQDQTTGVQPEVDETNVTIGDKKIMHLLDNIIKILISIGTNQYSTNLTKVTTMRMNR